MRIADRLRDIREMKNLSQKEVERRTGLLRSYLSRVENGHTVPTIETLEKIAQALEVPLFQFFFEEETPAEPPPVIARGGTREPVWGSTGKEAYLLRELRKCLRKMDERHRQILLKFTAWVSRHKNKSRQ